MDEVSSAADERSEEEIAWDKEFLEEKPESFGSALVDIVKLAVKVPLAILQMPMSLIPEETARHTRAAVRETFLAFRSLLSAIGDGVENALAEPSGPDGTWGTGPSQRRSSASPSTDTSAVSTASSPQTGSRSRRIEWSDDDAEDGGDATRVAEGEEGEGDETRGLKADIDY